MSITTSLFDQAQLAEAAYANFWDSELNVLITNPEDVKTALIEKGFSPTQADEFIGSWQVVSHQPDTLTSDFSATLFQYQGIDPNGVFQDGQYVYAIRGTAARVGRTRLQCAA